MQNDWAEEEEEEEEVARKERKKGCGDVSGRKGD